MGVIPPVIFSDLLLRLFLSQIDHRGMDTQGLSWFTPFLKHRGHCLLRVC